MSNIRSTRSVLGAVGASPGHFTRSQNCPSIYVRRFGVSISMSPSPREGVFRHCSNVVAELKRARIVELSKKILMVMGRMGRTNLRMKPPSNQDLASSPTRNSDWQRKALLPEPVCFLRMCCGRKVCIRHLLSTSERVVSDRVVLVLQLVLFSQRR